MDLELETQRLGLRPIAAADVPALHALWTLPEVRRWLFDDNAISEEEARAFVARSEALGARGLAHWSVRTKSDGALVGSAALLPLEDERPPEGGDRAQEIELLYVLHPSHWRNGYATEVGEALLAYAFSRLALPRVVAQADRPNVASIRVMERLGMQFEREFTGAAGPLVQYVIHRPRT